MNENTYYETLLSLPADLKKTELIITRGACAGSKALFSDGRIAACTGSAEAAAFFESLQAQDAGFADTVFQGTGEIACGGRSVFYEQLKKKARLVVCGAGHVGIAICRIASITGLEVIVIDDRSEYDSLAWEAGASRVICAPFDEALAQMQSDLRTCFVLVTRGHAHGMECLRTILKKPHLYVGMMASRKRAGAAARTLLEDGFSQEEVSSVHMPVGLHIGAETPGEIAVSVMAEVIEVIRGQGAGDGYLPDILDALRSLMDKGKDGIHDSAVLATIVKKSGEAPREPGTRMLVLADKTLKGSIGGGYAEAEIVKAAEKMLQDPRAVAAFVKVEMPLVGSTGAGSVPGSVPGSMLRTSSVRRDPVVSSDDCNDADREGVIRDESMICGGRITVLLERIAF